MASAHTLIMAGAAALLLTACGGGDGGEAPRVQSAGTQNEAWTLAAPADVGMDGAILQQAVSIEHFRASIIVQRHGKPVLEHYWKG